MVILKESTKIFYLIIGQIAKICISIFSGVGLYASRLLREYIRYLFTNPKLNFRMLMLWNTISLTIFVVNLQTGSCQVSVSSSKYYFRQMSGHLLFTKPSQLKHLIRNLKWIFTNHSIQAFFIFLSFLCFKFFSNVYWSSHNLYQHFSQFFIWNGIPMAKTKTNIN